MQSFVGLMCMLVLLGSRCVSGTTTTTTTPPPPLSRRNENELSVDDFRIDEFGIDENYLGHHCEKHLFHRKMILDTLKRASTLDPQSWEPYLGPMAPEDSISKPIKIYLTSDQLDRISSESIHFHLIVDSFDFKLIRVISTYPDGREVKCYEKRFQLVKSVGYLDGGFRCGPHFIPTKLAIASAQRLRDENLLSSKVKAVSSTPYEGNLFLGPSLFRWPITRQGWFNNKSRTQVIIDQNYNIVGYIFKVGKHDYRCKPKETLYESPIIEHAKDILGPGQAVEYKCGHERLTQFQILANAGRAMKAQQSRIIHTKQVYPKLYTGPYFEDLDRPLYQWPFQNGKANAKLSLNGNCYLILDLASDVVGAIYKTKNDDYMMCDTEIITLPQRSTSDNPMLPPPFFRLVSD